MKRTIILSLLLLFASIVVAQVRSQTDQVDGVETVNFDISASGNYAAIGIDILFTEVGGTTDGWVALLARNGSGAAWQKLPKATWAGISYNSALDTLQITDGASHKIKITEPAFSNYRVRVIGTSGDTTSVTVMYHYRKY